MGILAKDFVLANLHLIQPKNLQEAVQKILVENALLKEQADVIERLNDTFANELQIANEKISEYEKKFAIDLPGEIWKDIEGLEGEYQVSNKGRVCSLHFNRKIILKNYKSKSNKYFRVNLKKKVCNVHRLVADAFIPNPENLPFVNHIDGNKLNNCLENLEWVTASENMQHAYQLGLNKAKKGVASHKAKLTEEQVRFIRRNYKKRDKKFNSIELAKYFNVSARQIRDIVNGKYYEGIE